MISASRKLSQLPLRAQYAHAFLELNILGNPVDLQLAEPERVSSTAVQHAKRYWSPTAAASCYTAASGELILVLPLRPLRQGTAACSLCMNLRPCSAHCTFASSVVSACSQGTALAAWQCMATCHSNKFHHAALITCVPVGPLPAEHAHEHCPYWLPVRRGKLS